MQQAPEFGDVAGALSELLAGRVLVAHNLAFDARFLDGEYARLGHELGVGGASGLCTMRLAKRYTPGPKVTLEACCERCGIDQRARALRARRRAGDGRAAASLPRARAVARGRVGGRDARVARDRVAARRGARVAAVAGGVRGRTPSVLARLYLSRPCR